MQPCPAGAAPVFARIPEAKRHSQPPANRGTLEKYLDLVWSMIFCLCRQRAPGCVRCWLDLKGLVAQMPTNRNPSLAKAIIIWSFK